MSDDKPCCAADALRRIRQVKINGIMTGITMLDESIAEVRAQDLRERTGDPRGTDEKDKNSQLCPKRR